jgi:methylmalonyl-CoA mutase cobalamin-binding subunit
MTITLRPEQEKVLMEAVHSGLAQTPDEALDQAFDALRVRLPRSEAPSRESAAEVARRLATFGKRHHLSVGGMTVKQLLRESRPRPTLF